jgi:hypothetical protein
MNAMTSPALSPINSTPQIQPANFLNLLIVDDERSIREGCREVAQSLGFSACAADSAEHAYRYLDTQPFDAVLLDLRLPGVGGLDAPHQGTPSRIRRHCGDWLWHSTVGRAGHEEWSLRFRD